MFQNSLQMFAQSEFWQKYDLLGHEGMLGLILKNVLGRSLFDRVVLVLKQTFLGPQLTYLSAQF